jgi:hypothetical protein|eukprot:CAMPEP_0169101594 /NCGR_PEP_ID=MMETSP1015-20121227/21714_1 /TAXON_ID=342587 /ORGANISM="Karlodinium micrum, Strain CCMP2283" /LENGTH=87 /DNA_ID=CAMNT_0009162633 /DNA_START=1085 /DNA_END=1348 /DNA_ORIENTATION=-
MNCNTAHELPLRNVTVLVETVFDKTDALPNVWPQMPYCARGCDSSIAGQPESRCTGKEKAHMAALHILTASGCARNSRTLTSADQLR